MIITLGNAKWCTRKCEVKLYLFLRYFYILKIVQHFYCDSRVSMRIWVGKKDADKRYIPSSATVHCHCTFETKVPNKDMSLKLRVTLHLPSQRYKHPVKKDRPHISLISRALAPLLQWASLKEDCGRYSCTSSAYGRGEGGDWAT